MLLAEIGLPLGIGTETVAIPLDLVVLKDDRIDLSLTATEVRDILASAGRNRDSDDIGRPGSRMPFPGFR